MSIPTTIAIDGPAASGKTTLGEKLAEKFGYLFFDTGIMYRAVTWAAMTQLHDVNVEEAVTKLSNCVQIDIQPSSKKDGRNCDVLVDGQDITWEIRTPEIEANVSVVSAYPGVRQAMTILQRKIGHRGNVVMVGRDIGTVVMPDADLKLYLDASVEKRAERRYDEQLKRGMDVSYEEILSSMRRRDQIDSSRSVAPLKAAKDAIIIDTDRMTIQELIDHVVKLMGD